MWLEKLQMEVFHKTSPSYFLEGRQSNLRLAISRIISGFENSGNFSQDQETKIFNLNQWLGLKINAAPVILKHKKTVSKKISSSTHTSEVDTATVAAYSTAVTATSPIAVTVRPWVVAADVSLIGVAAKPHLQLLSQSCFPFVGEDTHLGCVHLKLKKLHSWGCAKQDCGGVTTCGDLRFYVVFSKILSVMRLLQ